MIPFKKILFLILVVFLSFVLLQSCDTTSSSSDYEPITVTGIVSDSQHEPIEDAIVRIINPAPEKVTTTNEFGKYSFELKVDSTTAYTIEVRKEGYIIENNEFIAIVERNVELPAFRLSTVNEGGDNDGEGDPPPEVVGEAASIFLESVSATDIGVMSTGQREDAQLVFQVVDEFGNPLVNSNSVDVSFRVGDHPDEDLNLSSETVRTNENGQASVTVTSGKISGTVQIIAEFEREDGTVRDSQPVRIVIHAGLPSQDHFTIVLDERNKTSNRADEVTVEVLVGDKYGNAVADETAIYFTTNGGFIYGSSFTNGGRAASPLTIGNPIPLNGIATITASTTGENEQSVSASTNMIFSGSPNISVTPETFNIANAEDQQFDYSVTDSNGNPMEPGTNISVTVEGNEIDVLGDVDISVGTPNAIFSNLSELTEYSFIIDDAEPDEINDTPVYITIEVDGPNGSARKTITGRKAKIQP
ncbi:hypothetical protein DYD21_13150 [Rhodohalobacter sp. SW132]|uniref:carboxypeptidase regulatory-like domain-containing protein n=1 Tax=Rhodohalobacter sp. SW132 TaxID=2293433 RepID=UPI000E241DAD|nr:carboxypeptidase regulatory-like domain-containing protein [Rhodohalobacter sp. SW132]REL33195.1 hypothetical protein DYD21_13150 [Rhodohalobacter sp. SW132]